MASYWPVSPRRARTVNGIRCPAYASGVIHSAMWKVSPEHEKPTASRSVLLSRGRKPTGWRPVIMSNRPRNGDKGAARRSPTFSNISTIRDGFPVQVGADPTGRRESTLGNPARGGDSRDLPGCPESPRIAGHPTGTRTTAHRGQGARLRPASVVNTRTPQPRNRGHGVSRHQLSSFFTPSRVRRPSGFAAPRAWRA